MFDWMGTFLAGVSPALGFLVSLTLWIWPGSRRAHRRRLVVCIGMAVFLAVGVNTIPSIFYYRDRPFVVMKAVLLTKGFPSASFPSDHVAASTAMSVVTGRYSKSLGGALWVLTALVGFNRIFVGVHYPLDVLAGVITGGLTGTLIGFNLEVLSPFASRVVEAVEDLTSI